MSSEKDKPSNPQQSRSKEPPAPHPLKRCFAGDAPGSVRPTSALLDRAADQFDGGEFEGALACAEEAARVEPRSVEAHHDRAAALQELNRLDEAEAAFARALALDPDDPETLAGAADLFINHLAPSNDHSETGLEYARHGSRRVKRGSEHRGLGARLALLEGQALNDLGRPREGLARLEAALAAAPDDTRVRYERAVSLFELCKFDDAHRALVELITRTPDDAWAHQHLGLIDERVGDARGAEREVARAHQLAPDDFPPPIILPLDEFRALVDSEVTALAPDLRQDLGRVSLEIADLPAVDDLVAEEPPLSPTILGLYRGAPLTEDARGEPRAIVLYRLNLGRAVASLAELRTQVRTTLLHELGHLRGEDDEELRARGLE